MKLSKSKLALAKVINENGGWVDDSAYAANDEGGIICGYALKPIRNKMASNSWRGSQRNTWIRGIKTPQWHQAILSLEEYYHAYPKADADGWVEWNGGECPVGKGTLVDVKYANGIINFGVSAMTNRSDANHVPGTAVSFTASNWGGYLPLSGIISYRLHLPEVKVELCESVTRSIPEPESKTTIEQLAQDYRNAKDYADRLQQEADKACAKADSILYQIECAGEGIGFIMNPIYDDKKIIESSGDWRKLKIGDFIWVGEYDDCTEGNYTVIRTEPHDYEFEHAVEIRLADGDTMWIDVTKPWKLISRP